MKKLLFIIPLLVVFMLTCGGESADKPEMTKDETTTTEAEVVEKQESMTVTVQDYLANPEQFVGKELVMEGTVVHVCKHGGKKLFIVGPESEKRVKFTTGKDMPPFDIALEGSKIKISGIVQEDRINDAKLDEMEKGLKEEPKSEQEHDEGKEHEEADEHHMAKGDQLNSIEKMREKIKNSEKGYISFFSLECIKFEVLDH